MAPNERHREPRRELYRVLIVRAQVHPRTSDVSRMGTQVAIVISTVGMTVLAGRVVVAARARWHRLRSWPRPGETELFPAGPRRVLLAETGLAGPE